MAKPTNKQQEHRDLERPAAEERLLGQALADAGFVGAAAEFDGLFGMPVNVHGRGPARPPQRDQVEAVHFHVARDLGQEIDRLLPRFARVPRELLQRQLVRLLGAYRIETRRNRGCQ